MAHVQGIDTIREALYSRFCKEIQMIYGDNSLFTREHYENSRGYAPAPLCELAVHCLELVSQLSAAGLKYRFKGGQLPSHPPGKPTTLLH